MGVVILGGNGIGECIAVYMHWVVLMSARWKDGWIVGDTLPQSVGV